jgi:hypothetical protein
VKAMFTGLVVDLLATGDRRRLTQALEIGLARLDQLVTRSGRLDFSRPIVAASASDGREKSGGASGHAR